jgi:NADH-quinone oxidoreductase subunit H
MSHFLQIVEQIRAIPWVDPAAITLVKICAVIGVLLGIVAYIVLVERRVCAFIQDRVGPNRVGPLGLLQPPVDGIKLFLKENVLPRHVKLVYYLMAPSLVLFPALLTIAVVPFSSPIGRTPMVIADLDVGILWVFSIATLGIYGIVLAGWASNSKYPFIGGIRSAAQMISYELAMGMSVIGVFMLVGSLKLGEVVNHQSGIWLVCYQPIGFLIFLTAMFAETNRLPCDMPEGEQELVAGYNTEYGSMKFGMFFMGEYANLVTASALIVTLFFGGWQIPFVSLPDTWWAAAIHLGVFMTKVTAFLFFFIWTRWTLPRFRYDQFMSLGWKVFIPLALANILLTGILMALKIM